MNEKTKRTLDWVLGVTLVFLVILTLVVHLRRRETHLFILSGQSNMVGLDPATSFKPLVQKAFGEENVIVVKHAGGGLPIRCWYRKWRPAKGAKPEVNGQIYDQLMGQVNAVSQEREISTITFVWMQGESDASEAYGDVYAASLRGLFAQVRHDLGREDVHFVIGRISDFDMKNRKFPQWTMTREAQVAVAESTPMTDWVDTDDLNGPDNALHYTSDGYRQLGERFAEKAIALIRKSRDSNALKASSAPPS